LKKNIEQVLHAKREGVNVTDYFIWTFLDNFEWAEGYFLFAFHGIKDEFKYISILDFKFFKRCQQTQVQK